MSQISKSPNAAPGSIKQVVGRCGCKSDRTVIEIGFWEGCALEGGGHTEFALNRCQACGKVCGFPDSNFEMAMQRGTEGTQAKLREVMLENLVNILGAALTHQNEVWGLYGNESKVALKAFEDLKI